MCIKKNQFLTCIPAIKTVEIRAGLLEKLEKKSLIIIEKPNVSHLQKMADISRYISTIDKRLKEIAEEAVIESVIALTIVALTITLIILGLTLVYIKTKEKQIPNNAQNQHQIPLRPIVDFNLE